MSLIRWNPNHHSSVVRHGDDVDRLFDSLFTSRPIAFTPGELNPPVDIEESSEGYTFRVDLPGVSQKDVKVSLVGDTLTVRGERKRETETKNGGVHRSERAFGSFERSFTLPVAVRGDQVKATVKDGILEIHVPKADEAKLREIEVQVG